jgi:ElaB/YqjD/DUF883 family membrane-anchored ribosome-binding protein
MGDDMLHTSRSTGANGQERLAYNLRHMVDEADHFLQAAAHSGDEKLTAVRDRFAGQLRQMRSQLDELEDSTLYRARHAARAADLAVQSHPYRAIGIAAAVGLLVGLLATRRW